MRKKNWKLTGIGRALIGNHQYPCDAEYTNKKKRKLIALFACTEVALNKGFPNRVRDLHQIKRRKEVKLLQVMESND